jgi:hypothetical protein
MGKDGFVTWCVCVCGRGSVYDGFLASDSQAVFDQGSRTFPTVAYLRGVCVDEGRRLG